MSTKRLVAAAKFLVAATKILFVVPNFVAVTKRFFPCCNGLIQYNEALYRSLAAVILIPEGHRTLITTL